MANRARDTFGGPLADRQSDAQLARLISVAARGADLSGSVRIHLALHQTDRVVASCTVACRCDAALFNKKGRHRLIVGIRCGVGMTGEIPLLCQISMTVSTVLSRHQVAGSQAGVLNGNLIRLRMSSRRSSEPRQTSHCTQREQANDQPAD